MLLIVFFIVSQSKSMLPIIQKKDQESFTEKKLNIVESDKISIKISTIKHTIIQYMLLKRKSTTSSYEKTIFSLNEKKVSN